MTGQVVFNLVAGAALVVLAGGQALLFRALFAAARDQSIRLVIDLETPPGGRNQLSPEELARAAEGTTPDDGMASLAGEPRGLR